MSGDCRVKHSLRDTHSKKYRFTMITSSQKYLFWLIKVIIFFILQSKITLQNKRSTRASTQLALLVRYAQIIC